MVKPPIEFDPLPGWHSDNPSDEKWVDHDVRPEVEEFAQWINYLLNPQKHDGPRRYVCRGPAGCGYHYDSTRLLSEAQLYPIDVMAPPHHNPRQHEGEAEWELESVLVGIDAQGLFHGIHAFCGILWGSRSTMDDAFRSLTGSHLCKEKKLSPKQCELYQHQDRFCRFRASMEVVQGIGEEDPRYASCLYYQRAVVKYSESLTNRALVLGEALERYRAIYSGKRDYIKRVMQRMTEVFDAMVKGPSIEITGAEIASAVLASVLAATVTPGAIGAVAYGMIVGTITSIVAGEIVQGVESEPAGWLHPPSDYTGLDNEWIELVNRFSAEMNKCGDEAFAALDMNSDAGLSHIVQRQLDNIKYETQDVTLPKLPPDSDIWLESSFRCDTTCSIYPDALKEYEEANLNPGNPGN